MKKIAFLLLALMLSVTLLAACETDPVTTTSATTTPAVTTPPTTTSAETTPVTTPVTTQAPASVVLVDDGTPTFQVLVNTAFLNETEENRDAVDTLVEAFAQECGATVKSGSTLRETAIEILVGNTTRAESEVEDTLAFNEALIRVVNGKVVIVGADDRNLRGALAYFVKTYVTGKGETITVPADLDETVVLDMTYSDRLDMTYAAVATDVWDSFNAEYWNRVWVQGHAFWDTAEIIEVYIDAYEQTKDPTIKDKMLSYADQFVRAYGRNWLYNDFNDDIMWICIAFSRITLLTGDETYYQMAKTNFDATYERAYSLDLGGGLFWRTENETKNSCVNCPGAIAACLLAQLSGDDGYYEKAKGLIDWQLDYMFEENTGRVYDSYNLEGNINRWASTYNQGTFIGACTYLYAHYQDDQYLEYAAKAADYAMNKLTNDSGIIDNNETGGNDLPGFKGILVRWLYRYAKATEDLEILTFLQDNADLVYSHRNGNGLIWTDWERQTPDNLDGTGVFSLSTAVALMFNCQPWW